MADPKVLPDVSLTASERRLIAASLDLNIKSVERQAVKVGINPAVSDAYRLMAKDMILLRNKFI